MEIKLGGHSAYCAQYHIVWIPKYRRRILNPGLRAYLTKIWPKIIKQMPGVEDIEKNIQVDHIHVIMVIPPKYSVSSVVGRIKQFTAKHLRRKFNWLEKVYWKESVVWSPGYFMSTIGLNEKKVLNYVRWQGKQDSGQMKLNL